MPKRRAKKAVKQPLAKCGRQSCVHEIDVVEVPENKEELHAFNDHEVDHRIAATQAIRDAEIEHLRTVLCLLRSNFDEEQLKTPIFQFLKENMPNLALKISEEEERAFEVEWNGKDGNCSSGCADQRNLHSSLLHRMHMGYPEYAEALPSLSGFGVAELAPKAADTNLLGASDLHIRDSGIEEPAETRMDGSQNAVKTSMGCFFDMIPTNQRLPKPGEMLHSVQGSPLGIYQTII